MYDGWGGVDWGATGWNFWDGVIGWGAGGLVSIHS
tara:strand:+ start:197 stop:301 length:105 start_codon:yes stop_codon:yes gene_type:complete